MVLELSVQVQNLILLFMYPIWSFDRLLSDEERILMLAAASLCRFLHHLVLPLRQQATRIVELSIEVAISTGSRN